MNRTSIAIVGLSALIIFLGMGVRQANGLFLGPVTTDLGIGRTSFSLAIALQGLMSGLPLLGILADRIGPRRVLFVGALVYGAGFLVLGTVASPPGLYLTLGLMIGLAQSAVGYVVVLGAVAQAVPERRRTTVFGLITAAGSLGMFGVVPVVQWLVSTLGWQGAATGIATIFAGVALLALGLPGRAALSPHLAAREPLGQSSLGQALQRAGRHRGYWLLNAGFFVCGFHVAFVATHLPAFLTDNGMTPALGATALSLVGLFNLFGSTLAGWLGDRYRKKILLSGLYFLRAVVISLFLLVPLSAASALVFGAVIGFLWLATVPLTSGMVAQIFGSRFLSTLYGIVFLSHQLGAFLGVWLGGRAFDATGSYTSVWLLAVALGLVAAIVHLPISDTRIRLPGPATEPAAD